MNDYPDFSIYGYQIERELSQNFIGGRVTYLARQTQTNASVIIKQFQFAKSGAQWSEYEEYDTEINILKHLNHPSIPNYLDSFQTSGGFCLVQEYKQANSLAESRHWSAEEIKQIAIGILQVLVYLQQQKTPIFHRDLKPENILVDRQQHLKVYLIDFGFARMDSGELAASSVVKGTLGFMPPEQMFNRQLAMASDLYSLGVTLICLLTKIRSEDIGNFINSDTARLEFQPLVKNLSQDFVDWLTVMTAPLVKDRYLNAKDALVALESLQISGVSSGMSPSNPQRSKLSYIDRIFIAAIIVFLGAIGLICFQKPIRNAFLSDSNVLSQSSGLIIQIDEFVKQKKYPEAALLVKQLIDLNPDNSEAWIQHCILLQKAKNSLSALESCDRALSINPNSHLAWIERGFALLNVRQLEESLLSFERSLELENSARGWYGKAQALSQQDKQEEAITALEKALEIRPEDVEILYYKATILEKMQRYDDAIFVCDSLLKISPNDSTLWVKKGELWNKKDRKEAALYAFSRAIKIRSDDPWAWYWQGETLASLERDREAIDSYNRAIQLYPGWSKAMQKRDALKSKNGL
jgi:serine/threonine protein kinase